MTEELAGVADIMTGGILARAVEPQAGDASAKSEGNCLNCLAVLTGAYCQGCGQKAHVHRTLASFGHDIAHSVLHLDGKIWRTLPMLAWHPGELTRRYIHGERAKFVSPIALFLFMVFLTFAVFHRLAPEGVNFDSKPMTAAKAAETLTEDKADVLKDIAELQADRKEALAEGADAGWIDTEIARNQAMLRELDTKSAPEVRQKLVIERKLAIQRQRAATAVARLEAQLAAAQKAGKPAQAIELKLEDERMGAQLLSEVHDTMLKGKGPSSKLKINFLGIKSLEEAAQHAAENPQLLFYKIQSNAYKFSWALIPISVPFMWLLFFWRRHYKLFDHAVFVTYSLCFMMALAAVGGVILSITKEGSAAFVLAVLSLIFLPPIHMYRQLHRGYQISRAGALWRTLALSNFALLALVMFSVLIIALGVTG
jgi:Protein of unknown function (DUF3667)